MRYYSTTAIRNTDKCTIQKIFLGIVAPQDRLSCKVVFSLEHSNAKAMFYSHRKGTLLQYSARISPWTEGLL